MSVADAVERRTSSIGQTFKTAAAAGLAFAVAEKALSAVGNAVGGAGQEIVGFATHLQGSKVAWTQFLGSGELAAAFMLRMQGIAAKTPFEFQDVERGTQRLVAMGFTLGETEQAMMDAIAVSSGFNKGVAGVDSITIALGQMRNAGHIYAQDMNQLIAVGVPAWEILADATGLSVEETRKQAEQGKITSDVMLTAFHEWAQTTFGDVVANQSHVLLGALSTIKDNLKFVGATAFAPILESLTALANRIADFTESPAFMEWATRVAAGVTVVLENVGQLAGYFTSGLQGVLGVVASFGQAIYEGLQWLNPFARHSPSLVENVTEGVALILAKYGSLAGIGAPLTAAGAAVQAFGAATKAAMDAAAAAEEDATAKTLAIFGDEVPQAYHTAVAAVNTLKESLAPLEAQIQDQQAVVDSWAATVKEAQTAVDAQQAAIKALERGMRPYEEAVKSAQTALDAQRQRTDEAKSAVDRLKASLDEAKQRLADFANVPLAGTKAFANRLFDLDQQITAVQLKLLQWRTSPELAAQLAGLRTEIDAQQGVLDQFRAGMQAAEAAVRAKEQAIRALEEDFKTYEEAVKSAQVAVEHHQQAVERAKGAVDAIKGALDEAKKRLADFAATPLAGTKAFADRLFAIEQQATAVQLALLEWKTAPDLARSLANLSARIADQERVVEAWRGKVHDAELAVKAKEASIAGLERALQGYEVAQQAATVVVEEHKAAVDATRRVVDDLSAAMKDAQDQMQQFARTPVEGTQAFSDQLFAIGQESAALELQLTTMKIGGAPAKDTAALEQQLAGLRLQAQKVKLEEQLQLDPLRRQIQQLANPIKELPFDAIVKGIVAAKDQQAALSVQLAAAEQAWGGQVVALDRAQGALARATAARDGQKALIDGEKASLRDLQDALAGVKDRYDQEKTALDALNAAFKDAQEPPKALTDELARLGQEAEQVRLQEKLQLDPLRKQIQDLVNPTKELSFQEIVAGITATQGTIAGLEGSLAGATQAWEQEQAGLAGAKVALKATEAARDEQRAAIDREKAGLQPLRDTLDDLKSAYDAQKGGLDQLNEAYRQAQVPPKELTDELQRLQDEAEQTRLEEKLQLDPLRKQIRDLLDTTKELTFDEIVAGIQSTQGQIADLEGALGTATDAWRREQDALDTATATLKTAELARDQQRAAIDRERLTLEDLQDTLAVTQAGYDSEKEKLDTLKTAYSAVTGQIRDWEAALKDVVSAAGAANTAAKAGAAADAGVGGPDSMKKPKIDIDLTEQEKQLEDMKQLFDKTKTEIEGRVVAWKDRLKLAYQEVSEKIAQVRDTVMAVLGPAFVWIEANILPVVVRFAGFVRDNFGTIAVAIAAGVVAFQSMSFVVGLIATIIVAMNPLTLVIVGLSIMVGLFAAAWIENWGGVRSFIADTLAPAVARFLGEVETRAEPARLAVVALFERARDAAREAFDRAQPYIDALRTFNYAAAWDLFVATIRDTATWLQPAARAAADLYVALTPNGEAIAAVNGQFNVFLSLGRTLLPVLDGIAGALAVGVAGAARFLQPLLAGLGQTVEGLRPQFAQTADLLRDAWDALLPLFRAVAVAVGTVLVVAFGGVMSAIGGLIGLVTGALPGALQLVHGTLQVLAGGAQLLADTFRLVVALIRGDSDQIIVITDRMRDSALLIWEGFKNQGLGIVRALTGGVLGLLDGFAATAVGFFGDLYTRLTGETAASWDQIKTTIADRLGQIWETTVRNWDQITGTIRDHLTRTWDDTRQNWDAITGFLRDTWQAITARAEAAWNGVTEFVTGAVARLRSMVEGTIDQLRATWETVTNSIRETGERLWDSQVGEILRTVGRLKDTILAQVEATRVDLERLWGLIKQRASDLWNEKYAELSRKAGEIRDAVTAPIERARDLLSGYWDQVHTKATSVWQAIANFVVPKVEEIRTEIVGKIEAAKALLDTTWDTIWRKAVGVWESLKFEVLTRVQTVYTNVVGPIAEAKTTLDTTWDDIWRKATGVWENLRQTLANAGGAMKGVLLWPFEQARDAIEGIIKGFGNSIVNTLKSAIDRVRQFGSGVRGIINWVSNALAGSEAIKGDPPSVGIAGLARGTDNWRGGWAVVGEEGFELARLPAGAQVIPHEQSVAMWRAGLFSADTLSLSAAKELPRGVDAPGGERVPGFAVGLNVMEALRGGAQWVLDRATDAAGGFPSLALDGALREIGTALVGKAKDWALANVTDMVGRIPRPSAPSGAQGYAGAGWGSPSAAQLNARIDGGGRALAGMGEYILGAAGRYGVPASVFMGILEHESAYGAPNDGLTRYNNFTGLTGTGWPGQVGTARGMARPFAIFDSRESGVNAALENLTTGLYRDRSLAEVLSMWLTGSYTAAVDPTHPQYTVADYLSHVATVVQTLGGSYDPNRVVVSSAPPAAAPRGTAAAPGGQAGYPWSGWSPPLDGYTITQEYGSSDIAYRAGYHTGMDLAGRHGAPIKAAAVGKVIDAGPAGGYGNTIKLDHGNAIESIYAHLDRVLVSAGELMDRGMGMGIQGNTGYSTGEHLHFEIRKGGRDVNPREFVAFADGGVITEPIVGRGLRSGRSYTFGEEGREYVIPEGRLGDGRPAVETHYHYTLATSNPEWTVEQLKREQRREERLRGYASV